MEFLQTNWVWLLLMAGVFWLLFRGGLGCGLGRHQSSDRGRRPKGDLQSPEAKPGGGGPPQSAPREAEYAGHRGHRGC